MTIDDVNYILSYERRKITCPIPSYLLANIDSHNGPWESLEPIAGSIQYTPYMNLSDPNNRAFWLLVLLI